MSDVFGGLKGGKRRKFNKKLTRKVLNGSRVEDLSTENRKRMVGF